VVFGQQPFSYVTLAALALIVAGAVIGSLKPAGVRRPSF
jgi:hypothetical protein